MHVKCETYNTYYSIQKLWPMLKFFMQTNRQTGRQINKWTDQKLYAPEGIITVLHTKYLNEDVSLQ